MANYEVDYFDKGMRYDTQPTGKKTKKGIVMAGNTVPYGQGDLLALAEDMADGCHNHEVAIGLLHNKEADVRATILSLRTTEAAFGAAKTNRQAAMNTLQASDDAATEFLGNARKVLMSFLGNSWSAAWSITGFPDLSTGVPRTQEKRMNLCASLKIYFTNTPTQEVAGLGVTAALAETRFQALSTGRDGLAMKDELQAAAKQARDGAFQDLRKRAHDLIAELSALLADDDPRWHAFGLNMPADPNACDPVTALTLAKGTAGVIVANWPHAVRATRYRPFTQIVGVDTDAQAHDPVHDLSVNLAGFAAGQTVKVYIIAANDAGEAQPGPTEQITL